jgi:hypothetical protein
MPDAESRPGKAARAGGSSLADGATVAARGEELGKVDGKWRGVEIWRMWRLAVECRILNTAQKKVCVYHGSVVMSQRAWRKCGDRKRHKLEKSFSGFHQVRK